MNTITRTTVRRAVSACALIGLGAVAVPTLTTLADDVPGASTRDLVDAGDASLFVPVAPYRALDTRDAGKMNVDGIARDASDPSVLEFFADLEIGSSDVAIPAEAIAVSFNVTITQTEGTGFLQITANNASTSTSAINWNADGQQNANAGVTLLGAAGLGGGGNGTATVQVAIGGESGARTHVIIDITGYYVAAP